VEEVLVTFEAMKAFKEAHKAIFETFGALAEKYNTAVENAEKVVRAKAVSCGPFDLYQFTVKYDAQKLHDEIGREDFLKVGGKIETSTIYTVDKATIEMSIARQAIPPEVAEAIVKNSPSYHKPEKVVLL
jgi:hypothetical protein